MCTQTFTQRVGAYVSAHYGLDDGADLCFTLLETGILVESMGVEWCARVVAQHIEQA